MDFDHQSWGAGRWRSGLSQRVACPRQGLWLEGEGARASPGAASSARQKR